MKVAGEQAIGFIRFARNKVKYLAHGAFAFDWKDGGLDGCRWTCMYVVYHIREDFGRRKLALACLLWYNLSRETVFSTNQDRQIRRDPHKIDILVLVKDRTTRRA
jgi:hypothetical protein